MLSVIPAATTFSVTSPSAQAAASDQAKSELKTNNAEQLEARNVKGPKEDAPDQMINHNNQKQGAEAKPAEDKTSFTSLAAAQPEQKEIATKLIWQKAQKKNQH